MAKPLLDLTGNQDHLIQPTVVVVVVAVVDLMGVPGAAAMEAHMADTRAQATPAVKQVIRVPAGVLAILMDLHPMAELPVENQVSLFLIM
jgi:hypothetical protein